MKLLIIFILPVISAQRYRGPNEEPFLPIYPVYPYSPKLMKRGADRDFLSQLNPEVFAPKHSPRDSYALNYYSTSNSNSNREQSNTQAYSLANQQAYTTMSTLHVPQNVNYNSNPSNFYSYPLAVLAQPQSYAATAANYPNYQSSYQQAYVSANYPQQSYSTGKNQEKQRNESNFKDASFVDGSNYITIIKDLKDLEGQSTAQIPNAAYRLIGFEGVQRPPPPPASQPTPAASGYRYQQLDQMTAQALGRLIAQQSAISATAAPTYTPVTQNQYETEGYMPQTAQQNSPVIAKTGLAYVMNPMPINIVPRHIARGQDSYQDLRNQVTRPAVTQVSLEPSQGVYIPPMRIKSPVRYSDYYTQASPAYPSNDQSQQNSAYVYPAYAGYAGLTSPEMNYKLIDNNNNYYATKRNIKVLKS